MMLTALLLNSSYMYLPVGTAIMLNFLYPAIVCIVMGTVFRAGFSRLQAAAIAVSIAGMAFLTGAGGEMPVIGIVMAVVSAFTYGVYLVANEKGPANALPIEVKLFYVSLPGTVIFGILSAATGTMQAPAGGAGGCLVITSILLITLDGFNKSRRESQSAGG